MDPRYISLSLSSTDENGRTNSFESTFDGASASAEALSEVFNSAAESIHELVYVAPIKSQGMADPTQIATVTLTAENVDPETVAIMTGLAAPNTALREFPAPEPAPKPELRTGLGSWLAPDYGVANMTPGEVQRVLEKKDRDLEELDAKAMERLRLKDAELGRIREAIRGLQSDLQIRRRNVEDLEGQVAGLRSLNGQQGTEIHRLQETNGLKDAELQELREAIIGLQEKNEGLKTRNDNQSKTIQSMQERLDVFEAGAPGVANLQLNYEALRIEVSQAADDHTRLQDERDIARKERDQKTSELKDLQAVHEDLTEQFNDSQKKLKEDFGKALADAVDAAKSRIMEEHPTNTWIMKITAGMHINEILKRVAPDA